MEGRTWTLDYFQPLTEEQSGKLRKNMRLFAGNSNRPLAEKIAEHLGIQVCECTVESFMNSEIRVIPRVSVRGKHVYILQTGAFSETQSVNDYIMETYLLMDALQRSGAKTITLLIPCFPYARQDKKDKSRAPISAKAIASIFQVYGQKLERTICVDLHAAAIQGYFDKACDNLYCIKPIMRYLKEDLFDKSENYQEEFVAISPDEGAMKRTKEYASHMNLKFSAMSKQRNYDKINTVDETVFLGSFELIKGKTVLIFDDMIDTGGTMIKSVDYLVENGAKDAVVVVSHGILSGPAVDRINNCEHIRYVLVSDSLQQDQNTSRSGKIRVFTVSDMYAEVIRRLVFGESISEMF